MTFLFLAQATPHPELEFWLKVAGAILALTALFLTWRTHSERATFEMIDRVYSLCHALENHLLSEWRLTHLFCASESEYLLIKFKIQNSLSEATERNELAIKERLFAIHVFIAYEQVFYQWTHSSSFFHSRRKSFLAEMLAYFTDRLLVNPRLVALLDDKDFDTHLEKKSVEYLLERREAMPSEKRSVPDEHGPFYGVSISSSQLPSFSSQP